MSTRRPRSTPQTPADHHAEALALINDAADFPLHSSAHLALVTRASAHASLALYKPTTTRPKAEPKKETTS